MKTLEQLADEINCELDQVARTSRLSLTHAIAAGEAILEARRHFKRGEWTSWSRENLQCSVGTAWRYQRLAQHRDLLPDNVVSIEAADLYIRRQGLTADQGPRRIEELRVVIADLREGGLTNAEIGARVGLSAGRVSALAAPDGARIDEVMRARATRARMARAALRREERGKAIKKLGGTVAQCYSSLRQAADLFGRSAEATEDRDVRFALNSALAKLHAAEDELIKALGIEHGTLTQHHLKAA